jgi:hypothetical protein
MVVPAASVGSWYTKIGTMPPPAPGVAVKPARSALRGADGDSVEPELGIGGREALRPSGAGRICNQESGSAENGGSAKRRTQEHWNRHEQPFSASLGPRLSGTGITHGENAPRETYSVKHHQ